MNDTGHSRQAVLDWYDHNARRLAWRAAAGVRPDPYGVWLSEIMLQQTTVAVVEDYFRTFIAKWPNVAALAAADDDEVMKAWAGLGYYARARNLLKCARAIRSDHGGVFPYDEAGLMALPGIGPYTAAAIAAIAFDRPATVVDGNVERVIARYFAVREALPEAKKRLRELAAGFTSTHRPGDYAQAMMDLGAMVCTPRRPDCPRCPLGPHCQARAEGIASDLPVKRAKAARPERRGVAFWVERGDGAVLLRKRPPKGLLGGMSEIPSSPWRQDGQDESEMLAAAPIHGEWRRIGEVEHTFTHFHLKLAVWRGDGGANPALRAGADPQRCYWIDRGALSGEALPSLMRKVVELAAAKG